MFDNIAVLQGEFLGNPLKDYAVSLLIFLGSVLVLHVLKAILLKRIEAIVSKTKTKMDDFILKFFEKAILPILYFAAIYIAIRSLSLSPGIHKAINAGWVIILTIQILRVAIAFVEYAMEEFWFKKSKKQPSTGKVIITITKIVIWSMGAIFVLDNLGFNISAVIAGLGISGIAIALAAQTILGDLFNYFVIFFDKPFEEGDFLIIDDYLGTIEHIGIKTTRIRSLGGEQVVFSNSDLTSSRIKNYKRMQQRRIVFKLGVTYQTSVGKMKKIPVIITDIIKGVSDTTFDRAHFASFGDFSLIIEIVYYVISGDYNKYMDIQQEINFKIKEEFEKEGIEFAYPTQTLFVDKVTPEPAQGKK
ncbi:MAG: mechanosensitive ion channel family protein [bacterium]